MGQGAYFAVRIFSNNAALARQDEKERVLVGRGIGYGRRVGDRIPADLVQRQYFEVSSNKVHHLELVDSVDAHTLDACVKAVDQASELLGELHPSGLFVLAEHLAFTVQRSREGSVIANPLTDEIKAAFPDELAAAELVLRYINSLLDVELPDAEAAFIALHLNAARTGVSVKRPLQQANALAGIVQFTGQQLGCEDASGPVHDHLIRTLARLTKRVRAGFFRGNAAARSIERDLPVETVLARAVLARIWGGAPLPKQSRGEVAYLAVFLHGWRQEAANESRINPKKKAVNR